MKKKYLLTYTRIKKTLSLSILILSLILMISKSAIASDNNVNKKSIWEFLKGSTPDNGLFLGMLTLHINPKSLNHDKWYNFLVGGIYNSIFAATFENSFNDRTYVLGIQRDLYKKKYSNNRQIDAGYRLGLVYGYDQRMSQLAGQLKILPLPELYSDFKYKNVGIELSWAVAVVTAKFIVTF